MIKQDLRSSTSASQNSRASRHPAVASRVQGTKQSQHQGSGQIWRASSCSREAQLLECSVHSFVASSFSLTVQSKVQQETILHYLSDV